MQLAGIRNVLFAVDRDGPDGSTRGRDVHGGDRQVRMGVVEAVSQGAAHRRFDNCLIGFHHLLNQRAAQ